MCAMLTQLPGTDDLIALSIEGGLEKADVERAMALLDAAFERGGKVHLFVEVKGFTGMPLDAWLSDLGHGFRYLTRLKQFGRVAIVSDQNWIRATSRLESMLLPFVTYQVYTPEQRDHALSWAKGEVPEPTPPVLTIAGPETDGILTFDVDGRITSEAVEAFAAHIAGLALTDRSLRVLARIRRYDGFDPVLLVDPRTLDLKLSLLSHVARYALVGGPDWMGRIATRANPLLKMELRHFPEGQDSAARTWLREGASV